MTHDNSDLPPSACAGNGRARRLAWTVFLLGCTIVAVVLALTVQVLFLAAAGVLAGGTYAAWLGLSLERYLDAVDDATSPPVFPT